MDDATAVNRWTLDHSLSHTTYPCTRTHTRTHAHIQGIVSDLLTELVHQMQQVPVQRGQSREGNSVSAGREVTKVAQHEATRVAELMTAGYRQTNRRREWHRQSPTPSIPPDKQSSTPSPSHCVPSAECHSPAEGSAGLY